MGNQNWARAEREALCDLLLDLGPDAPTRCAGWSTADLAAHLLIRERRPDAAAGIMLAPLAGYSERIRRRARDETPFARLVERVRQGPPGWSLFGLPGMDAAGNTVEYFIHHEDVLRAQEGWSARALPAAQEEDLWRRLRMSRLVLRRLPAQITLALPDGRTQQVTKRGKHVRVHGPAAELILWAMGRKEVARVRLTGEADAVDALARERWTL